MFKKLFVGIFIVLFMFCGSASADINDGLELYYNMDGNLHDSSLYDRNGHGHGNITFEEGIIGQAAVFDGIDDYISIDLEGVVTKLGGYEDISVFVWAYLPDLAQIGNIISSGDNVSGGFQLALSSNLQYGSWIIQSNNTDNTVLKGISVDKENWHLIGFTWDGTTHKHYTDGVETNSEIYTGYMGVPYTSTLIGAWGSSDLIVRNYFKGKIDDLRIYNRVITDDEIQQLYTGIIPPTLEDRTVELESITSSLVIEVDNLKIDNEYLHLRIDNLETVIDGLQLQFGNHTHIYKTGPNNEHSLIDVETSIPF